MSSLRSDGTDGEIKHSMLYPARAKRVKNRICRSHPSTAGADMSQEVRFPAIERIVFGQPAAQRLRAEPAVAGQSYFPHRDRHHESHDGRCRKSPRRARRSLRRDSTTGSAAHSARRRPGGGAQSANRWRRSDRYLRWGSVTDAAKMVRLCLQHDITDADGFEAFRTSSMRTASGRSRLRCADGAQSRFPPRSRPASFTLRPDAQIPQQGKHNLLHPSSCRASRFSIPRPACTRRSDMGYPTGIRAAPTTRPKGFARKPPIRRATRLHACAEALELGPPL